MRPCPLNDTLRWMRLFGGLSIVWFLLTYIGPADLAEQYRIEAQEKVARPERVRAYYRELLCDCLKVHHGQWLRLQIVHQPDRELCNAVCIYEGGAVTRGTL